MLNLVASMKHTTAQLVIVSHCQILPLVAAPHLKYINLPHTLENKNSFSIVSRVCSQSKIFSHTTSLAYCQAHAICFVHIHLCMTIIFGGRNSYKDFEILNLDIRIRNHPDSGVNIKYHENVMLSVQATSARARSLWYKWERNGEDITHPKCSGVDTSTLTIEHFSLEHEGEYTCIVHDGKEFKSTSAKLKLGK